MCIIVMKDKGVSVPSVETLQTCFRNNPDGAGILYQNPGQREATILKGFMTWGAFEDALCRLPINKDSRAVFHFRITTAGGTRPENCHPFPVSTRIEDLTALEVRARKALIHNGIIGQGEKHLSDTQLFIRDFVARKPFINTLHLSTTQAALEAMTTGSRLVIFDGEHDTFSRTGTGWVQDKNIWYSNSSYIPYHTKATIPYDWPDVGYDKVAWREEDEPGFAATPALLDGYCPNCGDYLAPIGQYHVLYECPSCGYLYDATYEHTYYTGD